MNKNYIHTCTNKIFQSKKFQYLFKLNCAKESS